MGQAPGYQKDVRPEDNDESSYVPINGKGTPRDAEPIMKEFSGGSARRGRVKAQHSPFWDNNVGDRESSEGSDISSRAGGKSHRIKATLSMQKEEMDTEARDLQHELSGKSLFFTGVIVANSLQIGFENQFFVRDHPYLANVYLTLDIVFMILYIIEIVLNCREQGRSFFCTISNVPDVLLTALAILGVYEELADSHRSSNLFSHTKALRLLRFVRLLRLFRVMVTVPDLKMVIDGLYLSIKGLSWVLMLIAILIYVFAIFFTLQINNDEYDERFRNANYFGDMSHAYLTLLDIAILAEWGEIVRPVMERQPLLLIPFSAFALLSSFGMLNVMIGVIVDSTNQARKKIEDKQKIMQIENASENWRSRIHAQGLSKADFDGLAPDEFEEKLKLRDAAIMQILQDLLDDPECINFPCGLVPDDIIALLDFDCSGQLEHAEFKTGLERLFLGDNFQLTCLVLTVLGKLRSESSSGQQAALMRLSETDEHLQAVIQGQKRLEQRQQRTEEQLNTVVRLLSKLTGEEVLPESPRRRDQAFSEGPGHSSVPAWADKYIESFRKPQAE